MITYFDTHGDTMLSTGYCASINIIIIIVNKFLSHQHEVRKLIY